MAASLSNPKTWPPFTNSNFCSRGACTVYCPQGCVQSATPPPSPPDLPPSSSAFSPVVIGIIGILASAFLLVSYYAIISKYCGNTSPTTITTTTTTRSNRRRRSIMIGPPVEESFEEEEDDDDDDNNPSHSNELWNTRRTRSGLDEALIKSITTTFRYDKSSKGGGGLVIASGISTDCSVCLGEFEEGETLRVLPKCNHAFHVLCIDTWLKSHSNCPLCRANIANTASSKAKAQLPSTPTEVVDDHPQQQNPISNLDPPSYHDYSPNITVEDGNRAGTLVEGELRELLEEERKGTAHLGGSLGMPRDALVVIIGEGKDDGETGRPANPIRRSFSMDHARVLCSSCKKKDKEECCGCHSHMQEELCELHERAVGWSSYSSWLLAETSNKATCSSSSSNNSSKSVVLSCVMSSASIKRSLSSGRFSFTSCCRQGRAGRNAFIIPL